MARDEIVISSLNKTWVFDLDGTLVKHNGYMVDGHDTLLDGAKDFIDNISDDDMIIIITARELKYSAETIDFLKRESIRYDQIIFGAPFGERIIINDRKPSGLAMAVAVNTDRDVFMENRFKINKDL
jgi:NLI interacting factor-like phosphatase.